MKEAVASGNPVRNVAVVCIYSTYICTVENTITIDKIAQIN